MLRLTMDQILLGASFSTFNYIIYAFAIPVYRKDTTNMTKDTTNSDYAFKAVQLEPIRRLSEAGSVWWWKGNLQRGRAGIAGETLH